MKRKGMKWVKNVAHMTEKRNAYEIVRRNLQENTPVGRFKWR
jgi:hypothetical protein